MPITWRNIDAPDFSSAANILQQGTSNIQNALTNLGAMADQQVQRDTAANTAALMEGIRQNVTDTDSYNAYDLNQAAQQYGQYVDKNAALDMLLGLRPSFQQADQAVAENQARIQAANIAAAADNDRWVQNKLLGLSQTKEDQLIADAQHTLNKELEANKVPVEFEPEDDPQARTRYREALESKYKDASGEWFTFGDKSGQALMREFDDVTRKFDKEFKDKYGTVAPTSLIQRIMAELPKTEDGTNVVIGDFNKVKDRIMKTYAPPVENYTRRKQAKQAFYDKQLQIKKQRTKQAEDIIYGRI